jgi:hypothetical protein
LKGGLKKDLIDRLMRDNRRRANPKSMADKVKVLLNPVAAVKGTTKPPITQHYANTYKHVDNFNALLGLIQWPYKRMSPHWVWFIDTIRMVTVNAWILWQDKILSGNTEQHVLSLKEFIEEVCNELLV